MEREDATGKKAVLLAGMDRLSALNAGCQQHLLAAFVLNVDVIRVKAPLEQRAELYTFLASEPSMKIFMAYIHDFLLYTPIATPQPWFGRIAPGHSQESQEAVRTTPLAAIQAMLPPTTCVTPIGSLTLPQLTEAKVSLFRFFRENLDIFKDTDVYCAAIIGATDGLNDVQRNGEDLLKRLAKDTPNEKSVSASLYRLVLGDELDSSQMNGAASVAPQLMPNQNPLQGARTEGPEVLYSKKRTPTSAVTRTLILDILSKSALASTHLPYCVQLIFTSLFAPYNQRFHKIHHLTLGFAQTAIRNLSDAPVKIMSPVLMSGLSKYMAWLRELASGSQPIPPGWEAHLESLRIETLHAFSALGKRHPSLFSSNITVIEDLMTEMRENKSVVLVSSIQEALCSLCPSASVLNEVAQRRLKELLASNFEPFIHNTPSTTSLNAMEVDRPPTSSSATATSSATTPPASPVTTSSKFVAQFYANRCFPFSDPFCRYLNALGVNDTNTQVVQEAKRGLEPFTVVDNEIISLIPKPGSSTTSGDAESLNVKASALQWPSFSAMIELVLSKRRPNHSNSVLSFPQTCFQSLLDFLHLLLRHHRKNAGIPLRASSSTTSPGNSKAKHPSWTSYFELLQEAVITSGSQALNYIGAEQCLEIIQLSPLSASGDSDDANMLRASPLASVDPSSFGNQLKLVILSGLMKQESMRPSAKILGILATRDGKLLEMAIAESLKLLGEYSGSVTGRDAQIGALFAISAIVSSSLRLSVPLEPADLLIRTCEQLHRTLFMASKDKFVTIGSSNPLVLAGCEAIGSLGKWTPLIATTTGLLAEQVETTVLDTVLSFISSPDVPTVISASYSVAYMSLGNRSLISEKKVLSSLLATYVIKSEESHFSIGEALSIIASGWKSSAAADTQLDCKDQEEKAKIEQISADNMERERKCMEEVLRVVLEDYFLSSRPDTRMASAIWLLTMLKNCGAHPEVIKQLKAIQVGFQQLLSDRNEILQEVAGKALSEVYELGDEVTKKELVDSLVNVLQKGASTFKVTADSEIFSAGQMGTTPSGDKLTTYRELVTLASELNQPDLIYKFMQLSSHNALWNSKKGAAFATGELASRAKAQITPHLPQLVPKLYRASFDPNPAIAQSMNSIFTTLVSDRKAALVQYIQPVLRDLLDHCIDTQWRTREASCNALADLLATREYEEVADTLKELWERCFRVLDDIKESVRKAAEGYKKALSTLTLRLCDPAYTNREHGRLALEVALPHLLSKGLMSPVADVRSITMNMLQKLTKVASFLLKPHIAELIPALLASLAALDSAQLNYIEQHSASFGLSGEVFDEARVAMSKSSPVHATIDSCVQQVDTQNISDLAPKLAALLSANNHISTRAGTASVIAQLALTHPEACSLTAHRLMLALKKGIGARSPLVRKAYGYAMGQLSRWAKKKTLEMVVTGLLDSYRNSGPDDADVRSAVAEALYELSKASAAPPDTSGTASTSTLPSTSPISTATPSETMDESGEDILPNKIAEKPLATHVSKVFVTTTQGKASVPVLAPYLNILVPVVYLARFDANEETKKVFNKIWEEIGASLALYVPETVATFAAALDSNSWQMKQQGAHAIAKFAETLNLSDFLKQAPQLLQMLLTGLKGRIWTGKDALLLAFSKLVSCCIDLFANPALEQTNKITPADIIKAMSVEVARKNLEYKKAALACLTDILISFGKSLPEFDASAMLTELLMEQANTIHKSEGESSSSSTSSTSTSATSPSSHKTDSGEKKEDESAISRSIRQMAIQALSAAFPSAQVERQRESLPPLVDLMSRTIATSNQYTMKVSVVNSIKMIFPKVDHETWDQVVPAQLMETIWKQIFLPTVTDPYSIVRTAACQSLAELISQATGSSSLRPLVNAIEDAVNEADKLGQNPVSTDRLLGLISRAKNE